MAVIQFDALKNISAVEGSLAVDVWEAGKTVAEVAGANGFGKVASEGLEIADMVKSTSKVVNFPGTAGEVAETVAGNQLITDVVEEAGKQVIKTGNFAGKKGLTLGATTLGKVALGALGAFGAVAQGVQWYKDNPEFWTKLSQKCLPFLYKDPQNASWADIAYSALAPVAVDEDGQTFVQAEMLEAMAQTMAEEGIFSSGDSYSEIESFKNIGSTSLPITVTRLTVGTSTQRKIEIKEEHRETAKKLRLFTGQVASLTQGADGSNPTTSTYTTDNPVIFIVWNPFVGVSGSKGFEIMAFSTKPTTVTYVKTDVKTGILESNTYDLNHYQVQIASITVDYYATSAYLFQWPRPINNAVKIYPTDALQWVQETGVGWENVLTDYKATLAYEQFPIFVADANLLNYGGASPIPEIELSPDREEVPQVDRPLRETYPTWWSDGQTSVSPSWSPDQGEIPEKYVTWIPLGVPSTATPDGATSPEGVPQSQYQQGYADAGANAGTSSATDSAYQEGVLPNPYPSTAEQPSTGDSGKQPEVPSDPSLPPADVPVISGGNASGLWTVYNPSTSVLQAFGAWLWSDSPLEALKRIFSNSPSDGIIGLHMIYAKPQISGSANIKVGYLDSGVASNVVGNQYAGIDCGSVTLPLAYNNALDFGYTKVSCYLPFIGIVPLDSYDVMGKTVNIRYTVDVLTGTVLAQISVISGGYNAVMYTFNGSCAVEYPLTSGGRGSQMLSLITGAVSGGMTGGAGGALMGAIKGASVGADIRASGNLSGNAGAMGIRRPYIIIKRPVDASADWYNRFYGYPAQRTAKLRTYTGYVKVKDCHVEDVKGATEDEKNEIYRLLTSGVIIS